MEGTLRAALTSLIVALLWSGLPARGLASGPQVVVTIKPVHALAAAVMEGTGSPALLLDGAASPHAYALKPSEARLLQRADLVVRVSEHLETFLTRPLANLPKSVAVATLEEIDGLTLYRLRTGGAFDPDEHGPAGDDHGHDHGHAGGVDPHLWLDPGNARLIGLHLAETLGRIAPVHRARYKANAEALAVRLDGLAQSLAKGIAPVAGRRFLVFHDAYQYFERRFGVAAAGSVSVSPEIPPSAKRISALRARIARSRIVCVFAEPQFPPRVIDTIIEGTSAARGTLDPLGAAVPAGPGHYFELMNGLARDLKACLGRAS